MSGCPDGSGIGHHNASAFFRSRLPFAQINLIVWCVLIFSVVRGCDPTKEPPTPNIGPRFCNEPFACLLGGHNDVVKKT